jgi:two-component system, OmpR family, sensor histidine kinase VicK
VKHQVAANDATAAQHGHPSRGAELDPPAVLALQLLESWDDPIIGRTPDGVITIWNHAAQRLYGCTAAEALGKNLSVLLAEDRVDELERTVAQVAAGAGTRHFDARRKHGDGAVIDVEVIVSPIRDAGGAIVGTSTIQRDITERRRTDAATNELAAIVDSSNDAIVGKTLEGTVTSWNRGAERIYGYAAAEIVGKSIALLVPPGHPDELREITDRMLASGARTDHFETRRVTKGGRTIEVSLTVSPIRDADGKIVGASSVARDITEHKALKAALEEAELRSVLAVSRAKDEMVSLVSHELRTPLSSLLGFTELLYSREFTDERRKQYLTIMMKEGRRLTDLINDVLHIQRLEAGHQNLDFAPADIDALIHRAVAAVGEDAQRPIELRLAPGLPLVSIDTDAILQVLSNFLSNASRYSPGGGSIEITTRLEGDMVEVEVRDHGLGIPADSIEKVFTTFYRVESGDHRLIKGTGLGLSINRRIIEAHGGTTSVTSEGVGRGSRFKFTLKALASAALEPDVLIVEDDSGFARLLQEQFVARGLTTVRAADAETAERLLEQGLTARAVVADLVLPGLQGEEFVTRLGAGGRPAMPVLVLTVKSLAPEEVAALEGRGVTAVLPKEAGATQAAADLVEALVPKGVVA